MAASRKSAAQVRGMIRARMPGADGEILVSIFDGLNADIAALRAAQAAIVTKLNALGAKLNADAGVTDTNYATDYVAADV